MTGLKTHLTRGYLSLISLAHHSLLAYLLSPCLYLTITVIFNGNSQQGALLRISFNFLKNFQFAHTGSWPEFQEEIPSTLIYNNPTAKGNPAQAGFHQNQSRTLSQHLFTILLKLFSYHRINLAELIATWGMFLPTAHFLIIPIPFRAWHQVSKVRSCPGASQEDTQMHWKTMTHAKKKKNVLKASAQILWSRPWDSINNFVQYFCLIWFWQNSKATSAKSYLSLCNTTCDCVVMLPSALKGESILISLCGLLSNTLEL